MLGNCRIVDQRRRSNGNLDVPGGVEIHPAVIAAKMLNELELVRADERQRRKLLLVKDEIIGVLELIGDIFRAVDRSQMLLIFLEELAKAALGFDRIVEPNELDIVSREEIIERDDMLPGVRIFDQKPLLYVWR